MKIALLSDTHLAAAATDFTANCRAAIDWINGSGADLAIHLGDISADGIKAPAQIAEARAVLDAIDIPLLCVPGNHDIGDNPVAGIVPHEPAVTVETLARFGASFGRHYWSQAAGQWSLIGLNAQLFGAATPEEVEQRDWLSDTLADMSGPIGLLLHKPWFRNALDDDEVHPRYVPIAVRRWLAKCFSGCDLRFVASGHTHQLRRRMVDGIEHFWVPSTAFVVPDAMQEWIGEKIVGCAMLTLGEEHYLEFVRPPGMRDNNLADYRALFPRLREILGDEREA